ncbi:MAG: DUF6062 family protein [Bacillota bacterium]
MSRHMTYYNLIDAMRKPGCFICRLISETVTRYLDTILYENVNDVGVRRSLRESNGFCPKHAWLLCDQGDLLGHSIIYGDLVDGVLDFLKGLLVSHPHARSTRTTVSRQVKALLPGRRCPACLVAHRVQESYLGVLLNEFGSDPEFEEEFASSSGLCLPHLVEALEMSRDDEASRRLLGASIAKLQELKADLAEVKRKHDYRFSKEPWGSEKDAWIRAVEIWSGLR